MRMRLSFLFILFAVFFYFETAFVVFATSVSAVSSDCVITALLKMGSKGVQVECLQKKVGAIVDGDFGPLTRVAVMVFQSKNELVVDGIVGPITRLALNNTTMAFNNGVYPLGCDSAIGYSPTTGVKCDNGSSSSSASIPPTHNAPVTNGNDNVKKTNPNLVNLDQFIETVVEVNKKNGSSEQELKLMADTVRKVVLESNEDLNKKFEELLISESKLSANLKIKSLPSVFDRVFAKVASFLGITPSVAQASTGTPFGGALVFPFRCDENWMITISPLPPTYVVLLSYFDGTQGFASYNIPFTTWLLGTYSPVGICTIDGEVIIETEGIILPMTGSSPL